MILDERTSCLLDKINALCGEGGFKIAEEDDLLACFPTYVHVDGEELRRILRYLEERRCIDVKYADEGVYCLCPLPEGRLYSENARERSFEGARRRRDTFLWAALGAFLGALIGSALVWLLIVLLRVG